MKLGALGQFLGVTQNLHARLPMSKCLTGQVSELLRTWSSPSMSFACYKGVRRGREQSFIQQLSLYKEASFYCGF